MAIRMPKLTDDTAQFFEELKQRTGIEDAILRRIIMFIEMSMKKENGSPTKFAKKYGIMTYKDFYDFMKLIKQYLKQDKETIAMNLYTDMFKSGTARFENWMKRTEPQINDRDACFYSSIFFVRTFGQTIDNLKKLQKVISYLDNNSDLMAKFVKQQLVKRTDKDKDLNKIGVTE